MGELCIMTDVLNSKYQAKCEKSAEIKLAAIFHSFLTGGGACCTKSQVCNYVCNALQLQLQTVAETSLTYLFLFEQSYLPGYNAV
jgi:hypothetical protein